MSMLEDFLNELKTLVIDEEMSQTTKNYFLDTIGKFQHNWESRTSPNYDVMIKERDEQIALLQIQIERLEKTADELRHEKQETVEHYEKQLELKSKAIDRIVESNSDLERRILLAEELNFNLMESFIQYKERRTNDY